MSNLGIILAAGKSSRLYPAAMAITKQLMPVFDKPLIYYPLSTLMLGGIKNIVTVVSPNERQQFAKLYKSSCLSKEVLNLDLVTQDVPRGLPDAFNVVAQQHQIPSGTQKVVLILGDNIYYGAGLKAMLQEAFNAEDDNAYIFGTKTKELERFGVAGVVHGTGIVTSLREKPVTFDYLNDTEEPFAVTGLYVFPKDVFERAAKLKPSARGETEIVDLLRTYLEEKRLRFVTLQRGTIWFDTGTPDSMLDAAQYVRIIQEYKGLLVGSPHEVAYRNGWVEGSTMLDDYILADPKSEYAQTLVRSLSWL